MYNANSIARTLHVHIYRTTRARVSLIMGSTVLYVLNTRVGPPTPVHAHTTQRHDQLYKLLVGQDQKGLKRTTTNLGYAANNPIILAWFTCTERN